MNQRRKDAYRELLYFAMLDIRRKCMTGKPASWNPLERRRLRTGGHFAGVVADWLHNLASFSIRDFVGFDEEWFWSEYDEFCRRYPQHELGWYRERFRASLEVEG